MSIENQIIKLVRRADPDNPLAYVCSLVKPLMQEKMTEIMLSCKDCKSANHAIKTKTYGNVNAPILVITELFNLKESNKENYLEGTEEWRILSLLFEHLHIDVNQFFWINSVSCMPKGKLLPKKEQFQNCKTFVTSAIKMVDPIFIIVMGNAGKMFFDDNVLKIHGTIQHIHGIEMMPTYSPSTLLTMKGIKDQAIVDEYSKDFAMDIKKAADYINDKYHVNIYKKR